MISSTLDTPQAHINGKLNVTEHNKTTQDNANKCFVNQQTSISFPACIQFNWECSCKLIKNKSVKNSTFP